MDYGRRPYASPSEDYKTFTSEITDQYVKSIGGVTPAGMKRPYVYKDYTSMQYLFNTTRQYLGGVPPSFEDLVWAGAATSTYKGILISPNSNYYTDYIGGGIGRICVMTGGGSSTNVGALDGKNDDGWMEYPMKFSFKLFNHVYNKCWVNNNGNITFSEGLSDYIPIGNVGSTLPIVSIYFGDVDTRGSLSGVMKIRDDIPNQLIITWDGVGYYNRRDDKLNSFQLVIRGSKYNVPSGEGVIGFYYKSLFWEKTDTSVTVAAGFGDGSGHEISLPGSNTKGFINYLSNKKIWFTQEFINTYL